LPAIISQYVEDLRTWAPALLAGVWVTLFITCASMVLSMVIGLLISIARLARPGAWYRPVHWALRVYVEALRGVPMIVTLFILFFGLPAIGFTISKNPLIVGIAGLSMCLGAYMSEVFRAAILSVDVGQMEAAQSLGMSKATAYRRVVLPQAFLVAVPTLGGYFIALLKDTSLLGFISITELFRTGIELVSITFRAFEVYLTIGGIYLALSLIAAWIVNKIERRLRPLEQAVTGGQPRDQGTLRRAPIRIGRTAQVPAEPSLID
jgi:His/Glu/Gln/Arg/opine family amino acid ABC transporter permease subunit